ETGFTRVGEFHYLHHAPDGRPYAHRGELAARVAAAAADTGIGLTLLPVFYAHGGFGGLDPAPAQRRFVTSVDEFAQLLEACRQATQRLDGSVVGVAPHSLRAVAPDELPRIVSMSQEGPIHIHVAEQEREVTDCVAWSGQRPVEWLLDHAEVDGRWCLVHATHMTRGETAALARRGAVAGLCPVTEANLGDGLFPAPEFLAAGGLAGIGSDSNVLIDAAEEMRVLEYGQRLTRRSRNVLCRGADRSTARTIFDAVQAGGTRALGASPAGIAAGASADIVSLDATREVLLERKGDALLDGWVFAARDNVVDCVWRAGRAVVRHGRHVDRARIARRFARTLQELLR
ncbi:MAG TPA: formimidoylglutamate deiminase, partial [Steroidobacteraceae bacterium]|nr:formimidoylglutamate deiminase [Steroidobacteraceae bacterium]